MLEPTQTCQVAMRDGIRLSTFIFRPAGGGAHPAILTRTPYQHGVVDWGAYRLERYVAAGYAVVYQLCRGQGGSEGRFEFFGSDREDGYDAVEWVAAQPWCTGDVGMDGGSYNGSTQLLAAAAQPPHLRCIAPTVPSVDGFRETPYNGGILWRYHILNWLKLISVDRLDELEAGFLDPGRSLVDPAWQRRLRHRPAIDAADSYLAGDKLAQFRAFLSHTTHDEFWVRAGLTDDDYAAITVPVLLVSGTFDLNIGTMIAWSSLERLRPRDPDRFLLLGPWNHAQAYLGGAERLGPFTFGSEAVLDLQGERLAFFDRYLRRTATARPARVRAFMSGSNQWHWRQALPPDDSKLARFFLHSAGQANGAKSDGVLNDCAPGGEPPDVFEGDPDAPVIVAGFPLWDYREVEQHPQVLVYEIATQRMPLAVFGHGRAVLWIACSTPDADLIVRVQDVFPDGTSAPIAYGALRLRYRRGFAHEEAMPTGVAVEVVVPLQFIAHTFLAGHRLRVQVCATSFPMFDPNLNTGESPAHGVAARISRQILFHDCDRPSRLELPVWNRPP